MLFIKFHDSEKLFVSSRISNFAWTRFQDIKGEENIKKSRKSWKLLTLSRLFTLNQVDVTNAYKFNYKNISQTAKVVDLLSPYRTLITSNTRNLIHNPHKTFNSSSRVITDFSI